MSSPQRFVTNILCADLQASQQFYQQLLGLHPQFESDWYVQLTSEQMPGLELGLLLRGHRLVPEAFANRQPQGLYLTFVVDDLQPLYRKAQEMGLKMLVPWEETFYGVRRFMVQDPDGLLVEPNAPIPHFTVDPKDLA